MNDRHPASYRDPSGFVFLSENILYRQVNNTYKEEYDHLLKSGLFDYLIENDLLISHEEIHDKGYIDTEVYKILKPSFLPVITYHYEWSFEMLKDAALTTLEILEKSLDFGMILKDATPFNLQLQNGKFIWIDTLSFDFYDPKTPWIAYRQFCENFIGPLALMHYTGFPLQTFSISWPDGLPLEILVSLLPKRSKLNMHMYLHIHLHSKIKTRHSKAAKDKDVNFSLKKLKNIIKSLKELINNFKFKKETNWSDYYNDTHCTVDYLSVKEKIIDTWAKRYKIQSGIDVGSNNGHFTKIIAKHCNYCIGVDNDPISIDQIYKEVKAEKINVIPILMDISNPSPSIGFNNKERPSFLERVNVDIVLALAIIHHLAIRHNIPFDLIASFFSKLGKILIIEFIPKNDKKITQMLLNKKDIYRNYTEDMFKHSFSEYYNIIDIQEIEQDGRKIYLMELKDV